MLFHTTFTPKAGYTEDDQKRALKLWMKWQPPAGLEIKAFYMGTDGRGYIISEVNTSEAMYEGVTPWSSVLFDYEAVPVVEIDKAVPLIQKAIAFRGSK